MKIVFRLTLLITFTSLLISCRSGKSYQDYYLAANKAYNDGVNFNKPKPQKPEVDNCCGCENNNNEYYAEIASIANNVNSLNKTVDKLEQEQVLVKKEATDGSENKTKETSSHEVPNRKSSKPAAPVAVAKPLAAKPMLNKQTENKQTLSNTNVPVRKQDVTAVNTADTPSLKRYSIVVATLERKENASKLTNTLKKVGENTIVVQSTPTLNYVLMGSFDNEADVLQKKDEIYQKYVEKHTPQQLFKTYGIPFSDIWILDRGQ